MTHHGVSEIVKRFKSYNSEINEVFEDYLFIEHYYPILHKKIKDGTIELMAFESAYTAHKAPFKKDFIYGVISRMTRKSNPVRSFIEAVTLTENYLQSIIYRIYRDFPYKLETKDEVTEQREKLLRLIIKSADKEEMINKIAEEKIRSIFYGNPVDFFSKDKAKIGIGTFIKDNYKKALEEYSEIIARRNIFIHNEGKVDNKYIKEVNNTTLQPGGRPKIDKEYIRNTIKILRSLSLIATNLALTNSYSAKVKSKFQYYIDQFDKEYKGK